MPFFRTSCLLTGLLVLTPTEKAAADESTEVTVTYVLAPPRPLPEGLKAVAVIDSGVQTKGADQDNREQKWSMMAADMIESMLANSAARFGSGLQVAQRRLTQQILAEKDLQLAGLVDGPTAERAGKLLAVQGLIASQITVDIDVQTARKSTVDWAQLFGAAAQVMIDGNRESAPPPRGVVVQPRQAPPPRASGSARPNYTRQNRGDRTDPRDRRTNPAYRTYSDSRSRDQRSLRYRRYSYDNRYQTRPGVVAPPPGAVLVRPGPPVAPAPAPAPGPVAGGGPAGVGMKEVEEVSRHLIVHCSFTLIDAVTGQAIVMYKPPPYRKVDKATPDFLFGSMHETQLDPVDHFIGELVERGVQEFVSLLVPTEVEYRYEVVAKHSRGEAGVRALRADDFETAFKQFEAEARKEDDEPEPVFALGVVSELMGDPKRALDFYRGAASMDDLEDDQLAMYLSAKNRLTEHLPRIIKAPPSGVIYPGEAPPGPPPAQSAVEPGPAPAAGFGFESTQTPPRRAPSQSKSIGPADSPPPAQDE